MDIQAILPEINNAVKLSNNRIKCGDEFEKLLQQVNEDTDIAEMKKFLDEKFNVNTVVVDYSCEKTDTEAEMYDTAMLEKYDMHGGRNVIISKKTLLRMKNDSAFRCNAALCSRRKKHFIFDSINTITAPSFR